MNKKKIFNIIGIILGVLLILYFVVKIVFIVTYINPNIKNIDIEVNDIGIISKQNAEDYYEFDNLKFRNDFKDYEIVRENEYDEETKSKSIVLKKENSRSAVVIGIREEYFVTSLELNSFEKFYLKMTGWDLANEKEVILKSVKELEKGYNIFDSFQKILFTDMVNNVMLNNGDITTFTIDGLNGYVLEIKDGNDTTFYTEIVVLKNKKAYSVTSYHQELSEEYIKDFISTIEIN